MNTLQGYSANESSKPFPFLRLPYEIQVIIVTHAVSTNDEWGSLCRSTAFQSVLKWKQSNFHLNDYGLNGLDFPKLPLLHVNRHIRDIGLRTIFGDGHPPVWLRRKSPSLYIKPINLPLADGNEIKELPLSGCRFWRRLILPVKLPWAGQRNEILGMACLLDRLCSIRCLHLEVYLRPQLALHASRVRSQDWTTALKALENLPLEEFSFLVRCDVNIPDVLVPAFPRMRLTSMERLTPDCLQALINNNVRLFMINPDLVFDKTNGLIAFRQALRFVYDVVAHRFRQTFIVPLDQF